MMDNLRVLLYPIGFIANILFAMRFIFQWIKSEKKKKSYVSKSFWIFSLIGNTLLSIHAFIQLQFPLLLLQSIGALISLRNLDLMGKHRLSLRQMLLFAFFSLSLVTLFFLWQGAIWMRAPISDIQPLSLTLHIIGTTGMVLFASRFWIQWWQAERSSKSDLTRSFWWMSLIGAFLSLIYFIRLRDPVNILGYSLGILPYIRNLHLLKKNRFQFNCNDTLFVFAGEKSGDILGADLLVALKKKMATTKFIGVGGEHMCAHGFKPFINTNQFEVMGFLELIPAAFRLFINFHRIKKEILKEKPKAVILIDYAEFNMLLAKSLRKGGYQGKIIQYIVPSVWAWRRRRIKTLARSYDLLLSILPFEKDYFKDRAICCRFVGHPIIKTIEQFSPSSSWREECGIEKEKEIIALFPGSRSHEIENNLPHQLKAMQKLPHQTLAISVASEKLRKRIEEIAIQSNLSYHLVPGKYRYELMQESKFALSTCGTVILELALFQTPTVVTYKLSTLYHFLGRYLFRIQLPYFSLPNIILSRELFPEYIDKKMNSKALIKMVERVMSSKGIVQGCVEVKNALGNKNISSASEEIYALLMS